MEDLKGQELERLGETLRQMAPSPSREGLHRSRRRLMDWYQGNALEVGWTRMDTPLGDLMLAATKEGLVRISFVGDEVDFLHGFDSRHRLLRDPAWLEPCQTQLERYFQGELDSFDLKVDTSGMTDFQREVLDAIRAIPKGDVWTYAQVASAIHKPAAARAVGQALAKNPIPIVLPCHRVIASDGGLGGYAGGLKRKRRLLMLEGVAGMG
jgi:methylated-DNA-[protein]-cysteine S-methyltransferase